MLIRGGTKRDPSRMTDGPVVAAYAKILGTELIDWQRYVADVAGEIDPTTGTYYYDTVILSTPRQCGKSTLVDATDVRNAMWGPDRFIYYLAQTGKDASDHFKKLLKSIQSTEISRLVSRPYMGAGEIRQPFLNGSVIMPKSITKVAGHGVQGDKVTLDEAFSLTMEKGNEILTGFLPTMSTRLKLTGVQPQLWITSTEGDAESVFFNQRLDECRAGEQPRRTCWFDFGIPADADPEDMDVIMQWHPAAGKLWNREQIHDFRDQYRNDPAGWARNYGNRRAEGLTDRAIPDDLWHSTTVVQLSPDSAAGRDMTIGVAVDIDATATALGIAVRLDDGTIHVQLADVLPGTGAAPERVIELSDRYHAPICIDMKGTSADLCDRLHAMLPDDRFCELSSADCLTAGQAFVSGLSNGLIRHAADPELDASAANSARQWAGDAWRITRRKSTGSTAPLESCMLAAWGASHRPVELVAVCV